MRILKLWTLFLLVLIPIIIILYLLKQKAEDKQVSSLILWAEVTENIKAMTPFEKLKNNLLMYLQIIVMILLIVAMTAPYIAAQKGDKGNVIIIIDNSGSMNYLDEKGKTRLDLAKEEAISYVQDSKNKEGVRQGFSIIQLRLSANCISSAFRKRSVQRSA